MTRSPHTTNKRITQNRAIRIKYTHYAYNQTNRTKIERGNDKHERKKKKEREIERERGREKDRNRMRMVADGRKKNEGRRELDNNGRERR